MKNPYLSFALLLMTGCTTATYDPYVAAVENQLETRAYQTRRFEDTQYQDLIAAIIGTLQDYHFRIQMVDPDLGTITAYQITQQSRRTKLGGRTEVTILVRARSEQTHTVRINMTVGPKSEDSPELYQKFFSALHKRLHYQTQA